jgi:hypothetical protein
MLRFITIGYIDGYAALTPWLIKPAIDERNGLIPRDLGAIATHHRWSWSLS